MYHSSSRPPSPPPFRPTVAGCVGRDTHLATMLGECANAALYAFCAHTYRSLLCESTDTACARLFEALAAEAAELMRAFGRLQQATGGNPVVRGAIRVQPHPLPPEGADRCALAVEALCREAICDTKAWIDLCQTVMGRTQDRVVRSCLAAILSDLQRQSERLAHAVKE